MAAIPVLCRSIFAGLLVRHLPAAGWRYIFVENWIGFAELSPS